MCGKTTFSSKEWKKKQVYHFTFDQSTEYSEWQQKKESMFASGELPEVLFKAELSTEEILRYYEAGQLLDLRPYIESCMPNLSALLAEPPTGKRPLRCRMGPFPPCRR